MNILRSDTIVAISTAQGQGAIGIVRLSGDNALPIASSMFQSSPSLLQFTGGRFVYGTIKSRSRVLDKGLALVFKAPHSYTGEDVVEFQTHGSSQVLQSVLNACIHHGARLAQPGEFTLRAYLHGKLDLNQAEAVNQLVQAQTETAHRQALHGLQGTLSQKIQAIAQRIARVIAAIQAMLDYPEEGVPEEERTEPLQQVIGELQRLLDTAKAGRLAQKGAKLALLGKPNVGKSSLLNALLGYERSIVTPIAGTTRDYLEADLELLGIPITLVDTAGIRDTEDMVELAGVQKALQLSENADLVLFLADATMPKEDVPIPINAARLVKIQSKIDLGVIWQDETYIPVSSSTAQGLDALRERLKQLLLGDSSRSEVWLSSARQSEAVQDALQHVKNALHLPDELASYELEQALEYLYSLTGEKASEAVIEQIFGNFCVGK